VAAGLALLAGAMALRLPLGLYGHAFAGVCGLAVLGCVLWSWRVFAYGAALGRLDAGDRELAVEEALARQRSLWSATACLGAAALVAVLVPTLWGIRAIRAEMAASASPPVSPPPSPPVPVEVKPALAATPAPPLFSPSDSGFFVYSDDFSIPEAPLGFRDLDRACQVDARSYLCLLNEGDEPVAGGTRRVLRPPDATFEVRWYPTQASIDVHATGRGFSIRVAPSTGRTLAPGVYAGAERFAGIGVPELDTGSCNHSAGKFSVRSLEVSAGSLRRITLDFLQFCERNGRPIVGRISVEPDR
jgi:hypothetical protein